MLDSFDNNAELMSKTSIVRDLIRQQDFLLLLGKLLCCDTPLADFSESIPRGLIVPSDTSAECGFQRMLGGTVITGYYHPQFMKAHIKDQWLFVLDTLETIGRCHLSDEELDARRKRWLSIGEDMQIDLEVSRKDRVLQRQEEMAGLVGCCWIRCPLFGQDSIAARREILRCAGCRKVRLTRTCPRGDELTPLWISGPILRSRMPAPVSHTCMPLMNHAHRWNIL